MTPEMLHRKISVQNKYLGRLSWFDKLTMRTLETILTLSLPVFANATPRPNDSLATPKLAA